MYRKQLNKTKYLSYAAAGVFIFLLVWWLITYADLVRPLFLPSPQAVLKALFNLTVHGNLLRDTWTSLIRMLVGFMLASIVAVPLGIALGLSAQIEAFLEPLLDFVRYIPPSAFIPITILWFGVAEGEKIFIIFIGITPYLALLVADAVSNTRREFIEAALTMGSSKYTILTRVIIPPALPMIWDAMRVMMGAAWTFLIIVEIVGARSGLGHLMIESQRFLKTSQIFAAMAVVGMLGIITDYLFKLSYRIMFPWSEK